MFTTCRRQSSAMPREGPVLDRSFSALPRVSNKRSRVRSSPGISFLFGNATLCEGQAPPGDGSSSSSSSSVPSRPQPSPNNPYKGQIEQLQRELDEPCRACIYTGVGVCVGLSLYFAKLATEDSTLPKNRRFLWVCSAGSLVAGAFRWYLQ